MPAEKMIELPGTKIGRLPGRDSDHEIAGLVFVNETVFDGLRANLTGVRR
jgi:hypothetical protein